MSRLAKGSFLSAFAMLAIVGVMQIMVGVWMPIATFLVIGAGAMVLVALAVDYRTYVEFFTMRTTKHSLNMGTLILLVLTVLVCLNYLANKHNKTWDLTQEKSNSLSDQTTKILDGLKDDFNFKVFYRGSDDGDQTGKVERQKAKQTLAQFQDYSHHIKVRYINSYVETDMAIKYLKDLPDREANQAFVFIEHGDRKARVDQPIEEAAVTSALIKMTRTNDSKIYFLQGHGEKSLDSDGPEGIKDFIRSLGEASFKVEPLNLMDKSEIPADASVVAIVGPSVPYLDAEVESIRKYMSNGGRLFVAVDPGQRHNLAGLTKSLGVEFENNYVFTLAPVVGGGPATILGRNFDSASDITKNFDSSYVIFHLVSEVRPAPGKPASVEVHELVKTDEYAFTVADVKATQHTKPDPKRVTVAVSVKGSIEDKKHDKENDKQQKDASQVKKFEAVVFGDSDFISNMVIARGRNRDLGMNSIAQLAEQKDLVSIRPKLPKGTTVMFTTGAYYGVIFGGLGLPIILLIISGVIWFRRRGA